MSVPVNIGSEEMIRINDLAEMAIQISKKDIEIRNIDGPVRVRGRNSDNQLISGVRLGSVYVLESWYAVDIVVD